MMADGHTQAVQLVTSQVTSIINEQLIGTLTSELTKKILSHIDSTIKTPATNAKKISSEVEELMTKLYSIHGQLLSMNEKLLSCPHDEARVACLTSCVNEILFMVPVIYEILRITYES
jgi:hypothetical protein